MTSFPVKIHGETEDKFIGRFMADPIIVSEYPSAHQRLTVALSTFRSRCNSTEFPKRYSCRFIEPGLVFYKEYGNVLVRKEALDRMANSFIGCPVINLMHKNVSPEKFKEEADGVVYDVRYNSSDGWYWADFLVWDKATQRNCESNAYSVSCAYDVTDFTTEGGRHNSIAFNQEVIDGVYTHLAIVENPRYNDARIVVLNSNDGGNTMFKFWGKDKKQELLNADESTVVEIDGKEVKLQNMIDVFKKNSQKAAVTNLADDATVEIDGKNVSFGEIKAAYLNSMKEDEDEEEKKARENAEAEEKAKKEQELKNEADEKAAKEARENAESQEHFNQLDKAAKLRGTPQAPKIMTERDRQAAGMAKYGKEKNV